MIKLSTLLVALILFPLSSFAQQETGTEAKTSVEAPAEAKNDDSSSAPPSGKVERIQVTGSHIKRVDVEGPSPVLTLDRDYLDKTGFNSVADVLRDTTVAGLGGTREYGLGGSGTAGQASSFDSWNGR